MLTSSGNFEGGQKRASLKQMRGADGKKISYASRKAIVYDDHNSECSDAEDRDAVYEEVLDDELKPNTQFDNYKKQFESLMKHK